MKIFTITTLLFALAFLSFTADAAFIQQRSNKLIAAIRNTPLGRRNIKEIRRVASVVKRRFSKCKPDVCFALDGSGSISLQDYRVQTNFAQIVTAVLGGLGGSKFAANQYGGIITEISPLTAGLLGKQGIVGKLRQSSSKRSTLTFVAPGLQYCITEFDRRGGAKNSKKIVLLGDGRSNFLDDGRFGAVSVADRFLMESKDNGICGVLVGGNSSKKQLFRRIVGKANRLSEIPSYSRIGNALRNVVLQACS